VLESGRLKWPASLPLRKTLEAELRAFHVKVAASGLDGDGGSGAGEWRERSHDDAVLAVALVATQTPDVANCRTCTPHSSARPSAFVHRAAVSVRAISATFPARPIVPSFSVPTDILHPYGVQIK